VPVVPNYFTLTFVTVLLVTWGAVLAILLSNWSKKRDNNAFDFVAELRRSDAVISMQSPALVQIAEDCRVAANSTQLTLQALVDAIKDDDAGAETDEVDMSEADWLRELSGIKSTGNKK
jgi:hypothetical protein